MTILEKAAIASAACSIVGIIGGTIFAFWPRRKRRGLRRLSRDYNASIK